MKSVLKFGACIVLTCLASIVSCKKDNDVSDNQPPVVNAGSDQMIILPVDSVELNGNGSDADGMIVSYAWHKISGPSSLTIANPNTAVTKVKNLVQGVYEFELKATDNEGSFSKDSLLVIVIDPVQLNHPPVANAGADVSITVKSCIDNSGFAELDGSGSADPDGNIVNYYWERIYGPAGYILRNSSSAKASVENLSAGEYAFALLVIDGAGLASKDTMLISVNATAKEHDLNITFNSTFNFSDNAIQPCSYYYYDCGYSDFTEIIGTGTFLPLGEFNLYIGELADTAVLSDIHDTRIQIYTGTGNSESLSGTCSVNFKKLIGQGGGPFNGTIKFESGSAIDCDPDIFTKLPPLAVTGSLDLITQKVTMRIQGKVYF